METSGPVVDLSLQPDVGTGNPAAMTSTTVVEQGGNSGGSSSSSTVTKTTRTVRTSQIGPLPGTTSQDFSFFVDNSAPEG